MGATQGHRHLFSGLNTGSVALFTEILSLIICKKKIISSLGGAYFLFVSSLNVGSSVIILQVNSGPTHIEYPILFLQFIHYIPESAVNFPQV